MRGMSLLLIRAARVIPFVLLLVVPVLAQAQVTVDDYRRAVGLQARYEGVALNIADAPAWLDDGRFWYRTSVMGGHAFVLVDPAAATKHAPFDHTRLADALGRALNRSFTPTTLPFTTFTFAENSGNIHITVDETPWTCVLADYTCTRREVTAGGGRGGGARGAGPGGRGGGGGARGGGPGGGQVQGRSPDGQHVAFIRDHNVHVRPASGNPEGGVAVTQSGTEARPFTQNSIVWSPDSRKLAAYRVTQGDRRMVTYVDSSPADQLQPKTFQRQYTKPGDVLDTQEPVLIDVAARRETVVDPALFPNAYAMSRLEWRRDSRAFTFEYNQRGHQVFRVIEVNATDGRARAAIDEQARTFIHYSGRKFRYDLNDGAEVIWLSERSGWAHLYLHDGATGAVKHAITSGDWLVRSVVRVDEEARQVVFTAGGTKAGQNPYFVHYYRVNIDGTGLTALTEADGDHTVSFSPDRRLYVDTWSRVDQAPISQLRRTSDAGVVLELERGDLAPLTAAGWRAPETFVAKGRDGVTDIWGVIMRPTTFRAGQKYPVIEYIYAGPHDSFVPKNFAPHYGMQSLAELGFIVVQIDGMGTANRSKAFHDVAWMNIGDAGFPDRKLWHQAAAQKYAEYDISRVGIFGGSAGGQNSTGALLFHSDFYHVAVSFAGCHDNRMDKIWWNEQWMGWPIGAHYDASSNVVHAKNLTGKLLLIVPELDTNVDPASTMQVVNALIKANKKFDLLVMPGEEHGGGRRGASAPYGDRTMWDYFVTHLIGSETPDWNAIVSESTTPTGTPLPTTTGSALFGQSWGEIRAGWGG